MIFLYAKKNKPIMLVFEVTQDGYHTDSSVLPQIARVFDTNINLLSSYPQDMIHVSTGIYEYEFNFNAGTYLVDVTYNDPNDLINKRELFQISVSSTIGLSGNNSTTV